MRFFIIFLLIVNSYVTRAQYTLQGLIKDASGQTLEGATVYLETTDDWQETTRDGIYSFQQLEKGRYILSIFATGYTSQVHEIELSESVLNYDIQLGVLDAKIDEVLVNANEKNFGLSYFKAVKGMAIYHARKTEVIECSELNVNLANNSSRQVYAKVAGLNIWENDNSGIQLNIGGRGLSPDRTSNFNTRQNGYDISADALGYPETYYIPPAQSLERIEVVRGAASLQYGTQFGGLLNFITKEGSKKHAFRFQTANTYGSNHFLSSFNSIGGSTKNQKLRYYGFFQYKRGDGWRDFSRFNAHTSYAGIQYQASKRFRFKLEQTVMGYLAQQPGGLTDQEFLENHRQAKRPRNWFSVNWNITALDFTIQLSDRSKLNNRTFFLWASRQSLGNLQPINRVDYGGERDLIKGNYKNIGNEMRFLYRYEIAERPIVSLVGARIYKGFTTQTQDFGNADSTGTQQDFNFIRPDGILKSDYQFPSFNFATFAENYFSISDKFGITPGLRFEYIQTVSNGVYQDLLTVQGASGMDTLRNEAVAEFRQSKRAVLLLGIGASYKPVSNTEVYAYFSQNYRAINFNDMRILNPNQEVDRNLSDEKGFNADFGFRGTYKHLFNFDVTLFYLSYRNRIGNIQRKRPNAENPLIVEPYTLRTNIGDARVIGFESLIEADILRVIKGRSFPVGLVVFNNFTILEGRYTKTQNTFAQNKQLELVPPIILRSGFNLRYKKFQLDVQYSYTGQHYTDASNATGSSNAVVGLVDDYGVVDLNLSYKWKMVKLQFNISNLNNEKYFTRRASSYPGPGILPSDGISFYGTIQIQLGIRHGKDTRSLP